MNSLSWFLYLTDVATNLSAGLTVAFVICAVGTVLSLFVWFVIGNVYLSDEEKRTKAACINYAPRLAIAAAAFFIVAALIPSKKTLYLIAASEIGEKLAQTEAVSEISKEAYDALRSYLKSITKELATEKK